MNSCLCKNRSFCFYNIFCYCYNGFIVFLVILWPNQNNPTPVWLRLIGMHNEKTWFLKLLKIELYVFVN